MIEIFVLACVLGGLFAAEKGARQVKKEVKSFGRKVSGKNRRARNKRDAKKRAEEPGLFTIWGMKAAGIEDKGSLRAQIQRLERELAQCRRENEGLLHRIRDLRKGLHQVQTNPIHEDCTHEHCVDWRNLLAKVNGKASSAESSRWMGKR